MVWVFVFVLLRRFFGRFFICVVLRRCCFSVECFRFSLSWVVVVEVWLWV